MSRESRILINGEAKDFSCKNRRYATDIKKGNPHGKYSKTRGSVFPEPLIIVSNGSTLWLEYVTEENEENIYWLMWYDSDGKPTIPLSAVFNNDDLGNMIKQLTKFIP